MQRIVCLFAVVFACTTVTALGQGNAVSEGKAPFRLREINVAKMVKPGVLRSDRAPTLSRTN